MAAKSTKNVPLPKTVHHNIEIQPGCRSHGAASRVIPEGRGESCSHQKYAAPQFNSVLRKVCQIEKLESKQPPLFKNTAELTPRSKAAIAPKITQKLNFGFSQTVFKNLTPININDSILLPQQRTSLRKKYTKSANKVPPPDLCDFLDPLPPLVHHIKEPEIVQCFTYDQFDFYNSYLRLLN